MVTLRMARNCPFCQEPSFIHVPEDMVQRIKDWANGTDRRLIQEALPELSVADREVLISSAHNECFQKAFPPDTEWAGRDEEGGEKNGNNH